MNVKLRLRPVNTRGFAFPERAVRVSEWPKRLSGVLVYLPSGHRQTSFVIFKNKVKHSVDLFGFSYQQDAK